MKGRSLTVPRRPPPRSSSFSTCYLSIFVLEREEKERRGKKGKRESKVEIEKEDPRSVDSVAADAITFGVPARTAARTRGLVGLIRSSSGVLSFLY